MTDDKVLSVLEEIRDIQKENQRITLESQEMVRHNVERTRKNMRPMLILLGLFVVVGFLQVIFR